MAFAGTPGFVSLYGYMVFVGISTVLNLAAWWLNSKRTKSALAVRMLVLFGFAALMGCLSFPMLWSTPYPHGWIAFTSACAMLCFVFWRWKRDLTQFLEKKPEPESWRTAKNVIYQYGIPFTPIYVVLFGIFILVMSKFMLLTLPWLEKASGFYVLPYCLTILAFGGAIVVGGLKLIRSVCRPYFPDKPYVWATSRGLNVAGRFFVKWKDIVQISEDFGRRRAVTGAQIHTHEAGENGPLVVPFGNTTVDSREALKIVRAMAAENGLDLTDSLSPVATKISKWAMTRAYRKNSQLRQITLDALERLPKQIADAENDLADLPAQIARYENGIGNAKELKALSLSNLQKMKKVGGLKQYPDFPQTVQQSLDSNDASIRHYEQMIQDIPRRKAELEKHIAFLSNSLADWEDKKRRYMS
ncbi:MAG: hypothetical protein ABL985_21675 [Casimicrobium sp.]